MRGTFQKKQSAGLCGGHANAMAGVFQDGRTVAVQARISSAVRRDGYTQPVAAVGGLELGERGRHDSGVRRSNPLQIGAFSGPRRRQTSQFRDLRGGKNAIGALIPDRLYWNSMEDKTVQKLLVATGHGYDAVRERLSGVAPQLLNELQDQPPQCDSTSVRCLLFAAC
jgi:hypothetical protein